MFDGQQHMVNCFPPGHQPHDAPPDLLSLITHALDKLTRNTFQPALATQTTLLQSVALDHARPLPRDTTGTDRPAAGPVEMHLDQSRGGRARLNARKRALAGRRDGMDVRVLGVDAESRGGIGLSEEIRGMLDEEYADEHEGMHRAVDEGSASDEDVPLPATQAFGESSLQARMQSRSTSRGSFEAESKAAADRPFRAGEEDRVVGSSFRITDLETTTLTDAGEGSGDDRGLKRRRSGGGSVEGACGIEARFGLGRGHVRARVERGLGGRPSLWEAASGL